MRMEDAPMLNAIFFLFASAACLAFPTASGLEFCDQARECGETRELV
jgi:hypothetical protein